jgi:Fic family protein
VGLIKDMHSILLRGVRGQDKTPGRFRTVQAHIGRTGNIDEARFVPCPPMFIDKCMEALEAYLRTPDGMPPLVRAAMVHYQFETIHPFADGNGRVGRVLLLLQLITEGVLPAALLNPSAQLERHRQEYYDGLLAVSERGDWSRWIEFFARSIAEEARDAAGRIERFEQIRDEFHARVRIPRASTLLPPLVDEIFADPVVTVPRVMSLFDISKTAAQTLLDRLASLEIIREVTGKPRNRVYLAQAVVDLFSDPDINPPQA